MNWSPEAIEQVKTLAADGLSASQIAAEIGGVTRNAVVGIAHRQKFRFLGNDYRSNVATDTPSLSTGKMVDVARLKSLTKITAVPIVEDRAGMMTMTELEFDSCRFIFGDVRDSSHRYCGQKQYHKSYCQHHYKITHETVEVRNARRGL